MTVLLLVLIFAFSITQYEAAKILAVFPTPSVSHQVVFRPFTQELAKRGHKVTIVTTDPAFPKGKTPANLTEIDFHDISYRKWNDVYKITSKGDSDVITQLEVSFRLLNDVFETQLQTSEFQKIMKEEKFDLLLLEACVRSALVLSHVFNAPVIQIASLGFLNFNVDTVGASWHPFLYPNILSRRLYNLTNWEKMKTLWHNYKLESIIGELEEEENEMARRIFGPNTPTISALKQNVDMMFLNVHPIWESNRPVPPSVVYMWGILENPVKKLPEELSNYLDSSKHGVIYMSLGTNVKPSLLPPEKVQMLVKVFSELPYDVIWKWDKDVLPGRPKNIRITKWIPQSDLLRHPKVKLFITQGGLQSTDEAITAGVPLIGLPMLGDQWYNVEKYEYHRIEVKLDMKSLHEEQFKNAIKTVMSDPSFRHNIIHLRELMHDEPMKPLDRVIWWTEYVLRHGGASHLSSPSANISWIEYLELELLLMILFVCVFILSGISVVFFIIYQCIRNSMMPDQKYKNKDC